MSFARIVIVNGKAILHSVRTPIPNALYGDNDGIELEVHALLVLLGDGMKALVALAPEFLEESKKPKPPEKPIGDMEAGGYP